MNINNAISLTDISLSISNHVLIHSLHLKMDLSSPTYVIGHNGAGKSLLLKLLAGILKPTTGKIHYQNKADKSLFYSPHNPVLLSRSVYKNIEFVIKHSQHNTHSSQIQNQIYDAIDKVRLSHITHKHVSTLSAGEKQKLSLAQAISIHSKTIILDEPTSNLDPLATLEYEDILDQLSKENKNLILSTHNMSQLKRLANIMGGQVIFMHKGNIIETGCAQTFLHKQNSQYAKEYMNFI